MLIAKDTVVSLTYELRENDGATVESTDSPISYLHGGYDGIFPVVETALDGKQVGDACRVTLDPKSAFGEFDENLVREEPRDAFPTEVSIGMRFEGQNEATGESAVYTVVSVSDSVVSVDGNHPLAGKAMVFSCKVTAVRQATREELTHGHVHGEGGHHH